MKKVIGFLLLNIGFLFAQAPSDSLFLKPTKFINSDNIDIINKTRELISGCKTDGEKLKNIYEFVRDSYSKQEFDSFVASDVLKLGGNSCYRRAILLAALCRAAGIPSRLQWQRVRLVNFRREDGTIKDYIFIHGITGVKLNGKWYVYEPVGNSAKWSVWVQRQEENKVEFKLNENCLFRDTEKVKTETLPIFSADHSDMLYTAFWDKFYTGEIDFIHE